MEISPNPKSEYNIIPGRCMQPLFLTFICLFNPPIGILMIGLVTFFVCGTHKCFSLDHLNYSVYTISLHVFPWITYTYTYIQGVLTSLYSMRRIGHNGEHLFGVHFYFVVPTYFWFWSRKFTVGIGVYF